MNRSAYPTHADLLAQVADSEAEAAEVRRVLSRRVTDAEITRRNAARLDAVECAVAAYKRSPWPYAPSNHAHRHSPGCSRCESGLTQCTTPEACERAEMTSQPPRAGGLLRIVVLVLACWAAVAFTLLVISGVRP